LKPGEKLFEEKGKVTWQAIKSITGEGVTMEANIVGDIKGFGRGRALDGGYMATAVVTQEGALVIGNFQGVLSTKAGETVTFKGSGRGKGALTKGKGGFSRGANLATFKTDSPKLSWMNSIIAFWEVTADPKTLEFSGVAYDWN
jgi:hypothetical protein